MNTWAGSGVRILLFEKGMESREMGILGNGGVLMWVLDIWFSRRAKLDSIY